MGGSRRGLLGILSGPRVLDLIARVIGLDVCGAADVQALMPEIAARHIVIIHVTPARLAVRAGIAGSACLALLKWEVSLMSLSRRLCRSPLVGMQIGTW